MRNQSLPALPVPDSNSGSSLWLELPANSRDGRHGSRSCTPSSLNRQTLAWTSDHIFGTEVHQIRCGDSFHSFIPAVLRLCRIYLHCTSKTQASIHSFSVFLVATRSFPYRDQAELHYLTSFPPRTFAADPCLSKSPLSPDISCYGTCGSLSQAEHFSTPHTHQSLFGRSSNPQQCLEELALHLVTYLKILFAPVIMLRILFFSYRGYGLLADTELYQPRHPRFCSLCLVDSPYDIDIRTGRCSAMGTPHSCEAAWPGRSLYRLRNGMFCWVVGRLSARRLLSRRHSLLA